MAKKSVSFILPCLVSILICPRSPAQLESASMCVSILINVMCVSIDVSIFTNMDMCKGNTSKLKPVQTTNSIRVVLHAIQIHVEIEAYLSYQ